MLPCRVADVIAELRGIQGRGASAPHGRELSRRKAHLAQTQAPPDRQPAGSKGASRTGRLRCHASQSEEGWIADAAEQPARRRVSRSREHSPRRGLPSHLSRRAAETGRGPSPALRRGVQAARSAADMGGISMTGDAVMPKQEARARPPAQAQQVGRAELSHRKKSESHRASRQHAPAPSQDIMDQRPSTSELVQHEQPEPVYGQQTDQRSGGRGRGSIAAQKHALTRPRSSVSMARPAELIMPLSPEQHAWTPDLSGAASRPRTAEWTDGNMFWIPW